MVRIAGGVLVLLLALPALVAQDKPKDQPATPAQQDQALVTENDGGQVKAKPDEPPPVVVDKAAPEITGEDVDGKKFKLSDYKGKVVLLDFWGNW
jgi:cytochrome oxidase Cu insertion factor (SCO1/SenC/PrrC family)